MLTCYTNINTSNTFWFYLYWKNMYSNIISLFTLMSGLLLFHIRIDNYLNIAYRNFYQKLSVTHNITKTSLRLSKKICDQRAPFPVRCLSCSLVCLTGFDPIIILKSWFSLILLPLISYGTVLKHNWSIIAFQYLKTLIEIHIQRYRWPTLWATPHTMLNGWAYIWLANFNAPLGQFIGHS